MDESEKKEQRGSESDTPQLQRLVGGRVIEKESKGCRKGVPNTTREEEKKKEEKRDRNSKQCESFTEEPPCS